MHLLPPHPALLGAAPASLCEQASRWLQCVPTFENPGFGCLSYPLQVDHLEVEVILQFTPQLCSPARKGLGRVNTIK